MSMGIMGISAAFAQAASAKKGGELGNYLKFKGSTADPQIYQLSCIGDISIKSIKDGNKVEQTYSDLNKTQVSIQSDANSDILIIGDVTVFNPALPGPPGYSGITELDVLHSPLLQEISLHYNTGLTSLDLSACTALTNLVCSGCSGLTSLDLSANTALTILTCSNCSGLTSLDLSANTALTILTCSNCSGLTSLDLSACTALTNLTASNCSGLISIKYPGTVFTVSQELAGLIRDADANDGVVYTQSGTDGYDTIATAATAKGWTIEQL